MEFNPREAHINTVTGPFRTQRLEISLSMVVMAMATVASVPRWMGARADNTWSLAYARLAMNGQPGLGALPEPPKAHMRSPLWMAQEAVELGAPERALALVAPLSESESRDVLRIQGAAFFAMGDYRQAIGAWEEAGDYQSLANAAALAEVKGSFETAELAYRGGWMVDPAAGTLPLANFLLQIRGDPVAAEQLLRASLPSNGANNLNRLRALGLVLQAQSRWDEAIAIYQGALNESPDDLYTLSLIGQAYLDGKNDSARAQSTFERMISLSPSKGDGYFAMGQLMASEGKPEEADAWFLQAIDRNPDNPWWWVVWANTARDSEDPSLALDIYNEAVQRFPDYALLYFEMARAYQLASDGELAIQAIQEALAYQERPNAWFFVRAGEIYEWAGERPQARSEYLSALEVDPGNTSAHQAAEQYLLRLDAVGD